MAHATLKLFKDIAQTRSFSRAASMNGVSQSAASQQVQELERILKVNLLDRTRRPLVVTPEGELYAEYCRDVLRRHQELEDALKRLHDHVEGVIRVASIYSVGVSELIQLERRFAQAHPHAEVSVTYRQPAKVYSAVLNDEADLGLVSYPEPSRELTVIPWRREEMVLAAAPDHPIAKLAAAIEADPKLIVNVDVANRKVVYGSDSFNVTLPSTAHDALTSGKWDPIAELLEAKDAIHERMTALGFATA